MILQSLHSLYNRLAEDPQNGLPRSGYSLQNISFRVVINPDGSLAGEIQDARTPETSVDKKGKEKTILRPTPMLVPGQAKPPGQGINPCFLWDNTAYMLGYKPEDPKPERTLETFEAFRKRHLGLEETLKNKEFSAVCRFLGKWNPADAAEQKILQEISTGFGIFQISGQTSYVHKHPSIQAWWDQEYQKQAKGESGLCLVTGRTSPLAQLHDPAIKGVIGAQSSGAKLVSFNLSAFTSYSKDQGINSPVSESAAFAYCNALNFLLADSKRRFRVGDTTCVYWTDQPSPTPSEDLIPFLISAYKEQEDETIKSRLQSVLEKLSKGQLSGDDLGGARATFYILGLSPNASRLSVRFWHTGTLGDLAANLQKHFNDLKIVPEWESDPKTPSAFQLLLQTAREADDIPPLLSGALMRAILLGTRYPEALYTSVLRRIKTQEKDQNDKPRNRVTYLRAAILKAFLNRNILTKENDMPLESALNIERLEKPYHLGRLFAVLEQAQRQAHEFKLERTIRESYYGSASATPASIFPRIQTLYTHHLRKLSPGSRKYFEDWVTEIEQKIRDRELYPKILTLHEQGMFAVGYYHQKHAFKKHTAEPTTEPTQGE
jgi:CRISPR-associated protein Csd1